MELRGSPTVETLALLVAVYAAQQMLGILGAAGLLALDAGVTARPWTLVTSVYAHAGLRHLLGNAAALALFGPLVARRTTRARFHAFFLSTGAAAGIAEVSVGAVIGAAPSVLGASGAILGLAGYLLSGNVVSAWLLDRLALPPRVQILVFLAVAGLLTLATATPRTALVGHATGLVVGLLAGRVGLLEA